MRFDHFSSDKTTLCCVDKTLFKKADNLSCTSAEEREQAAPDRGTEVWAARSLGLTAVSF